MIFLFFLGLIGFMNNNIYRKLFEDFFEDFILWVNRFKELLLYFMIFYG